MIIDFKEIPYTNTGLALSDSFELFARDLLSYLGFQIVEDPSRGADGKKDLIILEKRTGVGGSSAIRWLVSCKHYAGSGKSVSDTDEPDITDRLLRHSCDGFIGFYSTIAATSLMAKLQAAFQDRFIIYDREKIEAQLLSGSGGLRIMERYFPTSYNKRINDTSLPSKIFAEEPSIECDNCGKNLLQTGNGIYAMQKDRTRYFSDEENVPYEGMYFACKGFCDEVLKQKAERKGLVDAGWEDIDDMKNPVVFMQRNMAFMNGIFYDRDVNEDVYKKVKHMLLNLYPFISKNPSDEQREQMSILYSIGALH